MVIWRRQVSSVGNLEERDQLINENPVSFVCFGNSQHDRDVLGVESDGFVIPTDQFSIKMDCCSAFAPPLAIE